MTMKEMYASMLIIGKTTEENQTYSTIRRICAKTGTQRASSPLIKMDATANTNVLIVMAGKSKNSTLTISK